MAKNKDTYYIIEEDCDELTCIEARSAVSAVQRLFDDLPEKSDAFYVTVFRAKDAKRFRVSSEARVDVSVESVK